MNQKRKRPRTSPPKGDLTAYWSYKEDDIMFFRKRGADGHFIYNYFSNTPMHDYPSFLKELDRRGYDLKTLKFSIKFKPGEPNGLAQQSRTPDESAPSVG